MSDSPESSSPRRRLAGLKPEALMAQGLAPADEAPLEIEVPGYEIEAFLGRGGMGAVFLARQTSLDRDVAVKLLAIELADDPQFLERLEREARTMAKLRHPNIVAVHDFKRTSDGSAAIVMELIKGGSLRDLLRRHPKGLPVSEALRIIRQIAAGLQAAHSAGIVHRDMKPENVLIEQDGRACVTDFGLAIPIHGETTRLTLTGTAMGTIDYMSPEQLRGGEVGARGDVYALGVIFYELLTGRTPCGSFDPPHRLRRDVSRTLSQVIMRALRPVAEERYTSVTDFLAALDEKSLRRRWLVLAALLLIGGVYWAWHDEVPATGPWQDGLARVSVPNDVTSGQWTKEPGGALISKNGVCSLRIEKEMPEFYDVRLRFTRLSGVHSVALFFHRWRCDGKL